MLKIKNLSAFVDQKTILKNISLKFKKGEIVVLSGHNGSGKSSLAQIIAGSPFFVIGSDSSITFEDMDITAMTPEDRARLGIFVSFQNPPEISGLAISTFLKECLNSILESKGKEKVKTREFLNTIKQNAKLVGLDDSFLSRGVNEGMSGGERKKCEVLQMLTLLPDFVILDEVDSGLDSQSVEKIGKLLQSYFLDSDKTLIIITHNRKILDYLKVDREIVMQEGEVIAGC